MRNIRSHLEGVKVVKKRAFLTDKYINEIRIEGESGYAI